MSKKTPKIRVGTRSSHQSSRFDGIRFGINGYGCKPGDFKRTPLHLPVDVFMREMARKWGQQ